jgi:hypothetical protein
MEHWPLLDFLLLDHGRGVQVTAGRGLVCPPPFRVDPRRHGWAARLVIWRQVAGWRRGTMAWQGNGGWLNSIVGDLTHLSGWVAYSVITALVFGEITGDEQR